LDIGTLILAIAGIYITYRHIKNESLATQRQIEHVEKSFERFQAPQPVAARKDMRMDWIIGIFVLILVFIFAAIISS
jgi:hypothetical protein